MRICSRSSFAVAQLRSSGSEKMVILSGRMGGYSADRDERGTPW